MATHVIRTTPDRVGALIEAKQVQLREALHAAAIESANATLPKVRDDSPVDQGFYKNAWEVIQGFGKTLAELRNDWPYAGIIESGARPFFPPLAPIVAWVERKFGDLTGMSRFRGRASLSGTQRSRALQIARAIVQKIGKFGLKPHWVMRKNLPGLRRAFQRSFERRLREIASKP